MKSWLYPPSKAPYIMYSKGTVKLHDDTVKQLCNANIKELTRIANRLVQPSLDSFATRPEDSTPVSMIVILAPCLKKLQVRTLFWPIETSM